MPVSRKWAYFDHAAVAPLSAPAGQVLREWADDLTANGAVDWSRWRRGLEDVRRSAATLIGAETEEIGLIRNTTEGINLVAEGFPWKPGESIVTPRGEFPSNYYPWAALESRGVEVRRVETKTGRFDPADIAAACDEKTRLVSVSWVDYLAGWRNDLDALADVAHRRGALLFVDAIQALGVFPLDVRSTPIDFLAADGHKWMLGPEGAGLFYVRGEHLDLLEPRGLGWNSVRHAGDFSNDALDLKSSASRYEGGSYNMAGLHALGASLNLLLGIGIESISERLLDVVDELAVKLTEMGANVVGASERNRRSGILSFELPGRELSSVRKRCLDARVVVNLRGGRLRISPHAYTDRGDIDCLLAALADP
ncbi:MAG: aminotransferase [Planctomycetaceae bacterium]|nr:aminotransferase [Planctomycetaceae bacterium]